MPHDIKVLLYDIHNAIADVESYFDDRPKRFDVYVADSRTRRAVERNLEIIGEATKRLLTLTPTITLSNARSIVAMRNRIAHGYDTVSDEIIWSVVINHLPELKREVGTLIRNLEL